MDRTQHPVQDIEMIHIYSTWDEQGEVNYVVDREQDNALKNLDNFLTKFISTSLTA